MATQGSKIHPTAVVSPGAELHESVEVGPYSVIENGVRIGEGSVIGSHVIIYSGATIGKNNYFYATSVINAEPQDLKFKPRGPRYLVIGDDNIFREDFNVSGSANPETPTRIGNNNYFMCDSHMGHDNVWGNHSIFISATVTAGHVTVGDYCVLGGQSAVHQFVRVGDYAMIGGLTRGIKDAPPYSMVDGSPAGWMGLNIVGLRRGGIDAGTRKKIKDAYTLIYRSGLNMGQAIDELKQRPDNGPEVRKIVEFFETSKRGVLPRRRNRHGGDEEMPAE